MSLCSIGCQFQGYNSETKKVMCECNMQNNMTLSLFFDSIINNEEIIDKFIDIKKSANLDIIKCYELLFSKEGLISNIGSYILLVILFLFFIFSIIFCYTENNEIKNKIYEIAKIKKSNNKAKGKRKKKKKKLKKKKGNKIFTKKKKKIRNININIMETEINNKKINQSFSS